MYIWLEMLSLMYVSFTKNCVVGSPHEIFICNM